MIIRWFQTWLRGRGIVSPSTDPSVRKPKGELIDVAHAVLSKNSLRALETLGSSVFEQKRKKENIRTRIRRALRLPVTEEESFEIADEITDKIAEACEADPRIDRLFNDPK